jgi:hypothetical protein
LAREPASPLSDAFEMRPAIGQMLVTTSALRALGPVLGWDLAERVWLGSLLVALLVALGWYVRRSVPGATPLAPFFLAWVPLSWVTALGFYDFLAGLVLFTLLLDALDSHGRSRILPILALLYFAHLFAFATAVGVLVLRSVDRPELRGTAAAVAVVGAGLVLAAPGLGGGLRWNFSIQGRLIHLAFGSTIASVSPLGILAGVLWTAFLVRGALKLPWDWRCRAGFLMLAGSLFVPSGVGTGSFLFERLHVLGFIVLAPLLIRTISSLPWLAALMVTAVMASALAGVFGTWTGAGRQLDADQRRITDLLQAAGVQPGASVTSAFPHEEMALYRTPVYFHLVDRSAQRLGAIVADNYQARPRSFAVSWVRSRSAIRTEHRGSEWVAWGDIATPMFVVHLADTRFHTGQVAPLVGDDRFAVTRIDPGEMTRLDDPRTHNDR